MERTISATDANREFSRLLGDVASGSAYLVTIRGKPVARMSPVGPVKASVDERTAKAQVLADELLAMPLTAPGRITRDDGYE